MRIRTMEETEAVRSLIGDQNIEACKRALTDGAQVWVFRTEEKINSDPELTDKEKEECRRIFKEEGLGYAGYVRPSKCKPTPEQILMGAVVSPNHDSHGNSRYRGPCSGKWSH